MAYQQTLPIDSVLIGEFRILGLLGSGGFANTYLAMDLTLGREVAIKEYFPSELAVRGDNSKVEVRSEGHESQFKWALRRFVREAKTLAKFRHTSVVRVHRVFNANETAYIVLEFVRGSNMESWLKQLERPPTQEELDSLLPPLLDALDVVHRAGVLHRDVKPANIYIRAADQSPVLLDFGAARFAAGDKAGTTAAIVSKGYSPHEAYATDSRLQGPWTDIYGLAATLYRALSGSAPPESTSRVLEDSCVPSREIPDIRGEYRPEFLAAIDAALAVMPTDRPQSIEDWRKQLLPDVVASTPSSDDLNVDEAPTQQWRPISDLPSGAESDAAKTSRPGRGSILKSTPPIVAKSKSRPSVPAAAKQAQWSEGSGPRTDVRLPAGILKTLTPNQSFWIGVALFASGSLTLASQFVNNETKEPATPVAQEVSAEPPRIAKAPAKTKDLSGAAREAEAARKRAEEDRRLAAERKRKEDEAARARKQEERRLAQERERKRKEDEAARQRADEERRLAEERERKRKEAEAARRRADEERRLAEKREQERKEAIAARERADEERRLAKERERKRKEAEAARIRLQKERKLAAEREQQRKDAEAAKKRSEAERQKKEVQVARLSAPEDAGAAAERTTYLIKVQSVLKESGCYEGETTGNLNATSNALGNFKRQYNAGTPPLELASATPGEFDDWLDWFAKLKSFSCAKVSPAAKPNEKYTRPQKPAPKKRITKPKKSKPKAKKKSASKKKYRKPKSSPKSSTESLLRGTR